MARRKPSQAHEEGIARLTGGAGNAISAVSRPLEMAVDGILEATNQIGNAVARSPAGRLYQRVRERAPRLPETQVRTPFGPARLPEVGLPDFQELAMDQRRRDSMKAALATDVSSLVGIIPVLGDIVADVVEDTYAETIRRSLTPAELDTYMKFDKLGPSSLAMARTWMRESMAR